MKTAQDLLSKDNVKGVFICKIPPRLDNQMRNVKVTEINEKVVESMQEMNIVNLFLIESVSKEIQNFNKDSLHLSKTGLRRLSAVMLSPGQTIPTFHATTCNICCEEKVCTV